MDDACLNRGHRPHVTDYLGQSFEPVADQEEGVLDAPVSQIGEHTHPEICALTSGAGPQAQDIFLPGQSDSYGCIDRPVGYLTVGGP